MKTRLPCACAASTVILFAIQFRLFWGPDGAFAQGSLTPPASALSSAGAPVATMVTLQQIEPRTPISSPYAIYTSVSYYLTTNLTISSGDAIDIIANGVTLDLNGFTISTTSTSSSGNGAAINLASATGNTNVTIVNGHILGEFIEGITYVAPPSNIRVSGISVSGSSGYGIYLATGSSTVVESCTVNSVAGIGIDAAGLITRCTATNCGTGIKVEDNGIVIACAITASILGKGSGGDGIGIDVYGNSCTVKNCNAGGNEEVGINVSGNNCTVTDCDAGGNGNTGFYVGGNSCTVTDCNAGGNGLDGIYVFSFNSTVKDCNAGDNVNDGIVVDASGCLIGGNTCGGNGGNGLELYSGYGGNNRIDNNTAANNNSFGIIEDSSNKGNSITRNSAPGNAAGPYSGNSDGNNDFAPVQTPAAATSPWANF